jgi:hypothetical protein
MSQRTIAIDSEPEGASPKLAHPVRVRAAKKPKNRTRKSRRKRATANGMHRRANKRTNW